MKENTELNKKFDNNSDKEKALSNKIQNLQSQCENIINQRSQEFKNKLKTLDEHASQLKTKNEKLIEENQYYKKFYNDNEHTITNLQKHNQELEDQNEVLKDNTNDIKITQEKNMLKLCMLETMNQVLGRNMGDVDERTLELLEIDKDRVKLTHNLDQIYRNHTYNNLINYFATNIREVNNIEFSKQEFIQIKNKLKEEQRKRLILHNTLQELRGNIRVCVRVRKLLPREVKGYANPKPLTDWLDCNGDNRELAV